MTLRDTMTTLFGIGSLLLAADSCAASPLPGRARRCAIAPPATS